MIFKYIRKQLFLWPVNFLRTELIFFFNMKNLHICFNFLFIKNKFSKRKVESLFKRLCNETCCCCMYISEYK